MKEGGANMRFKESKRSAYRSRRSPPLAPGLPQATLVEGRDEDFHGVDSVHFPTVCNLISTQATTLQAESGSRCCFTNKEMAYPGYGGAAVGASRQSFSGSALAIDTSQQTSSV